VFEDIIRGPLGSGAPAGSPLDQILNQAPSNAPSSDSDPVIDRLQGNPTRQ
jgi:hypothetical protein